MCGLVGGPWKLFRVLVLAIFSVRPCLTHSVLIVHISTLLVGEFSLN